MKIIISTNSIYDAPRLMDRILNTIKGLSSTVTIDTWSYTKSGDNFDIIYHDVPQYTQDTSKNVLFRVSVDGINVVFSSAWWSINPEPSKDMICLHTGRLTEMLLCHFSEFINKYTVTDF